MFGLRKRHARGPCCSRLALAREPVRLDGDVGELLVMLERDGLVRSVTNGATLLARALDDLDGRRRRARPFGVAIITLDYVAMRSILS